MEQQDSSSNSVENGASTPAVLTNLATQTLGYFEEASAQAEAELRTSKDAPRNALAVENVLTSSATQNLNDISENSRRNLMAVVTEPAIARVEVLNEDGDVEVVFITPGGAPRSRWGGVRVASYHSPMGRLAATRPGVEVEIPAPAGARSYEVVERALLHPSKGQQGWDSRDTVVEALNVGPLTIGSLRALLRGPLGDDTDPLAELNRLLQESAQAQNIQEGVRRAVLERIGIRARPVLDAYQDEIFRLPLDRRLAILGPPGSGKTTTLIKRLRYALDLQALEDQLPLIDRTLAGRTGHAESWYMFSPSELLRQYVKEAFNREGLPASDRQLHVWQSFRLETARNRLGILRSGKSSGGRLRPDLKNLQTTAIERQTSWFDDFDGWQKDAFWAELRVHAGRLTDSKNAAGIAARLARIVEAGAGRGGAAPFVEFRALSAEVGARANELQAEIDLQLQTAFALRLKSEPDLLKRLLDFLPTLGDASDEGDLDDPEADDDDSEAAPLGQAAIAEGFDAYMGAMRAQARALAQGRRLGPRTRYGRIVEWLGSHGMAEEALKKVGATALVVSSLRRLANPMRMFLNGVRGRYTTFRRIRQAEGLWYEKPPYEPSELSPLEVDAILLAMLRIGRLLLADPRISSVVDEASISSLQSVRELFRTQVMVDEATDFSPLQLACMGALCDPAADAFLACGDFNQRITAWGARSEADLRWVFADIDIRPVHITYRHSRQLNALAHAIASLDGEHHQPAVLPEHVDNEGVDPVIGNGLSGELLAEWLAERIVEIEQLTQTLPSIAVLVNSEAQVQPLADALQARLEPHHIQCSACPGGQVRGNDNDVRIFDVQHIKGLEFEAVIFVGIDELAEATPELFDKFLYVGATRAAMYLGLTTAAGSAPARLAPFLSQFGADWTQVHH